MEMLTDIAIAIFAESFADEIENIELFDEDSRLSPADIEQIQTNYILGYDLSKTIPELFSDFGLNIQDYLPYAFVRKVINAVDFEWRGRFSIEAFYELSAPATCHFMLDLVGYSFANPEAYDLDVEALFKSKDVKTPSRRFEIEPESAKKALLDLSSAFKKIKGNSVLINNDNGATN